MWLIERAPRPEWCADLESFVSKSVSSCENATLYGSWAACEETLLLVDNKYYVMSDIDISYSGPQGAMDLLQRRLAEIIPRVRVDWSDAFAFANENQTKQRLLKRGQIIKSEIEAEEIAEAIAIRLFYSSLDVWLSVANRDIHGAVYSLVRMVAEIPLYFCWSVGLICGSYQTQLSVGVDRTALLDLDVVDLVQLCVGCKTSVLIMHQGCGEKDVYRMFEECICVFANVIRFLALDQSKYGNISLNLLEIIRNSWDASFRLDQRCIKLAWNCYRDSVMDGRVRNQYLLMRVAELGGPPLTGMIASRSPVCLAAR